MQFGLSLFNLEDEEAREQKHDSESETNMKKRHHSNFDFDDGHGQVSKPDGEGNNGDSRKKAKSIQASIKLTKNSLDLQAISPSSGMSQHGNST